MEDELYRRTEEEWRDFDFDAVDDELIEYDGELDAVPLDEDFSSEVSPIDRDNYVYEPVVEGGGDYLIENPRTEPPLSYEDAWAELMKEMSIESGCKLCLTPPFTYEEYVRGTSRPELDIRLSYKMGEPIPAWTPKAWLR